MHPTIYRTFETICSKRDMRGRVLEVGAVPKATSLLRMSSLRNVDERIGLNLDGPYDCDGYHIVRGNANDMSCFETASFDVVLSNAMLEHDKFFWRSIAEMHRVLKPSGTLVIGTPGYTRLKVETRIKKLLKRLPGGRRMESIANSTPTFQIHNHPGDYYRFSPQTYEEVFFEGFADVQIMSVMIPPRIIGSGVKRA